MRARAPFGTVGVAIFETLFLGIGQKRPGRRKRRGVSHLYDFRSAYATRCRRMYPATLHLSRFPVFPISQSLSEAPLAPVSHAETWEMGNLGKVGKLLKSMT